MKSSGHSIGCENKKNQAGEFKKGNQLWKRRARCGRPPKYRSAEQLLLACEKYFEWVEQHPLYVSKVVGNYNGEPIIVEIPKHQPMTIRGLCIFLGISHVTWYSYKKRSPDFLYICSRVEQVIWVQKFEGAVLGFFKPSIIAREIHLRDCR